MKKEISINTDTVSTSSSPSLQEELDHEQGMVTDGITRYRRNQIRNEQSNRGSSTRYGKTLLARAVEPLANRVTAWLDEINRIPGRHASAAHFIRLLPADVTALITAKVVIDGIAKRVAMTSMAHSIGARLETEFRHHEFEKSAPGLYKTTMEKISENVQKHSERVRMSVVKHAMKKFGVAYAPWSVINKVHVGLKMLDLFIESTGLVQMTRVGDTHYKKAAYYIEATPELIKFISDFSTRSEVLSPTLHPTIIAPKAWVSAVHPGGYYSQQLRQPLVKRASKALLHELGSRDLKPVIGAINAVQATPYRVGPRILEAGQMVMRQGIRVAGLPHWQDIPKPDYPAGYNPEVKGRARWANVPKDETAKWYALAGETFKQNLAAVSKRLGVIRTLYVAERYKDRRSIWFPHNLDFRGRLYALPQYLNPQGSDLARGLLEFAEGKPLGERGVWWLRVHLANTFGYDKASLDERVQWAVENAKRIIEIGNDALSDLWWTEADKPFQFLQACMDYAGYVANPDGHLSHTPIMVDGSNNGVQHLAALSRDAAAGALVNLVPGPKPADIYAEVARRTVTILGEQQHNYAQPWLTYGLSRSDVKRPTMIFPYNGTQEACKKYLLDSVRERTANGDRHPFGPDLKKAVTWLSKYVWQAINETVNGPRTVMKWMCESAKQVAKQQVPISWTVPTGFVVVQGYKDRSRRLVKARIGDQSVRVVVKTEIDKFDTRRQSRAIPPNYVHSLDAAALMLTVNHCVDHGITSFAAIHDSYGTHACDMDMLAQGLRDVFAWMYYDGQALQRLRHELQAVCPKELTECPPMGTLDIDQVRKSQFFFA